MTHYRHQRGGQGSRRLWIAVAAAAGVVVVAGVAILIAALGTAHPTAAAGHHGGTGSSATPTSSRPSGSASSRGSRSARPGHASKSPKGRHSSAEPRSSGGTYPASTLAPSYGALFGAWVAPTDGDTYGAVEDSIRTFEGEIGRRLAIDQLYVPWGNSFPMAVVDWDISQGILPMISWGGTHTNQIAAGVYDSVFEDAALQLKALHRPIMLRWFPEMDGSGYRSIVASPRSFIAAWRHVHNIFVRAGATNVIWVWCPNALHFAFGVAQSYYPGSRYVDWIGADGYNWAPKLARAPWRSFASIFGTFYRWGASTGKPLLVGEFGVLERRPGEKAAWYRQTDVELRTMFPDIKALVYFNSDQGGYDWRINTSASSLAAFRAFANDPYFRARPR
jgi:Glycosyl hydrolase family 26